MKILYVDLGLHYGKELNAFIAMCKANQWQYEAHGVEASEKFYHHNKTKQAKIHHLAISEDREMKLYKDLSEGQGNSVYATKNNVGKEYEFVQGAKFSTFMSSISYADLNILRFNIEGAEWDLVNDMIATGLHKKFQLFLGEPNGEDIAKCGMDQALYLKRLKDNNIEILPWCHERPGYIDLEKWIKGFFT